MFHYQLVYRTNHKQISFYEKIMIINIEKKSFKNSFYDFWNELCRYGLQL